MSQIFGIFRNRNIAKITVYFFFSLLLLLCIVPDGYGAGYTALRRPRNIHRASLGIT